MLKSYLSTLFLISVPVLAFGTQTTPTSSRTCLAQFQQQNFEQAFSDCTLAAEKNDAAAQNILGMLYQQGQGVELDNESALDWFEKAAKLGNLDAQLNAAKMYSKGWNWLSRPDYLKAFQYFSQAANGNHAEAQFIVALCYQNGIGVQKDDAQALYWYHQAVKHGLKGAKSIPAKSLRAKQVANFQQYPGNEDYLRSLTLKNKGQQSQHYLSSLTLAAEKGHPQAQYELAIRYLSGNEFSINDESANQWLEKAAKQNHQGAQSYLAWMAMLGFGMEPNQQEATKWFINARTQPSLKTADLSELNQVVAAISAMEKAPLNQKQGLKLYRDGVSLIEQNLSQLEFQKGLNFIHEAAESDVTDAQLYLAKLYQAGDKVEKNRPLAAQWVERAAKLGNVEAQYTLGWLYYHGEGVYPDRQKAYELFTLASKAGDKRSLSAATFVKSQLSSEQLAQITPVPKANHAHTL